LAPTGFLPEIDEGAFVLDYWSPGGTALAETDRMVNIVEKTLIATPEITGTSRRTGAELGLFATEQNRGDISVRLKPEGDRSRSTAEVIDEVRGKLDAAVPRLRVEFVQILSDVINDLAGAARPVEIRLFGIDLNALETYAKQLEPKLSKVDGVEDYFNGVAEPSAELDMTINQAEANRVGLTSSQVADAVCRRVTSGSTIDRSRCAFARRTLCASTRANSAPCRCFPRRRTPPFRSGHWRRSNLWMLAPSCAERTSNR